MIKCETSLQKEKAYDIIKINRETRGFPLRMTKEQLMDTIKIVDHDFFLVKHEETIIASAVVYRLTPEIDQVVYWGNIPDVSELRPINYIAYKLIEYYKDLDYKVLDIGISNEADKPTYGLCNFKESIGCVSSEKIRLELVFDKTSKFEPESNSGWILSSSVILIFQFHSNNCRELLEMRCA